MTALVVLAVVLAAACAAGLLLRGRDGKVRARPAPHRGRAAADYSDGAGPAGAGEGPAHPAAADLAAVGVGDGRVAVVHFSAPWCGPCAAVRRVLARVAESAATQGHPIRDIELDFDDNAALARQLGVLSLPTTFVFDGAGRECFRISGVPTTGDVERALGSLRQPGSGDPRNLG